MQDIMMIDNHKAKINYDSEIELFRGEFIGLNGGADFYSDSIEGLHREGSKSLTEFLAVCKENGIEPYRAYSGKFVTRLPSELHERIASVATAKGVSLNKWVNDTLASAVNREVAL